MSPESWQTICPRCGWANSGAERKCMKCGQPLRTSPGLLVAGQSAGSAIAPQATAAKRVVQPGGFFPRLIAQIVDALILGVIVVPVIYLWVGQPKNQTSAAAQGNFATDLVRSTIGGAVAHYSNDQVTQLIGLVGGLLILSLFYYAGTWSILGGSPGQLLMNLRVVDREARTLGFGQAVVRFLIKGIFAILAPVSAVLVAFGKDKRAVHDALAGSYVIQFLDPAAAEPPPAAEPAALEAALPPAPFSAPQAAPADPGYAGAAIAAAAVSGEAPPYPVSPGPVASQPVAPGPPPMTPLVQPTAQTLAPEAVSSAFEVYSAPSDEPAPSEPGAPAETSTPGLPEFPVAQPGDLQPMAPRPAEPLSQTARPAAATSEQPPPPAPYAVPFVAAPPPPDPPAPPPAPEE